MIKEEAKTLWLKINKLFSRLEASSGRNPDIMENARNYFNFKKRRKE